MYTSLDKIFTLKFFQELILSLELFLDLQSLVINLDNIQTPVSHQPTLTSFKFYSINKNIFLKKCDK